MPDRQKLWHNSWSDRAGFAAIGHAIGQAIGHTIFRSLLRGWGRSPQNGQDTQEKARSSNTIGVFSYSLHTQIREKEDNTFRPPQTKPTLCDDHGLGPKS